MVALPHVQREAQVVKLERKFESEQVFATSFQGSALERTAPLALP